jgi:elongation factor Ts
MAEITAGMVKELREKTDAPMMECKKALSEAAGDMAKAEEILRIKLGNKASKAAARVTAEGIVGVYISADAKLGAMVEVNCETDFVAKNDDFLALVKNVAELVATKNPADVEALSALELNGQSVEEVRKALIGKIGENMTIRRFVRVEAQGAVANYIHGGSKIGVLIDLVGGDEALAKDHGHAYRCIQAKVPGCLRRSGRAAGCRASCGHREGARSRQAGSHAREDR